MLITLNIKSQEAKQILTDTTQITFLDTVPRIELITKFENGKMFLRWAPNDPIVWYNNLFYGYKIERFEMDKSSGLPIYESRDTSIIKPWQLEAFRPYHEAQEKAKYILTMGECVHGKLSDSSKNGFTVRDQEINNKYGFALFSADMDFEAAVAGGLGAYDQNGVTEGKEYFYRVSGMSSESLTMPGLATVTAQYQPLPQPSIHVAIEGEGKVTLQWLRDDHEPFFSGYFIEKSKDGINYQPISETPFVGGVSEEYPSYVFSFTDFVSNYDPHYYRIVGISPFGESSNPSSEIKLKGRDRTPCAKPSNIKIVTDELTKSVAIAWDPSTCLDIKGYQILKGMEPNGIFTEQGALIAANEKPTFNETLNSTRGKIYYQIATVDTAGNRAISLPRLAAFRDTMPPAIPIDLSGEVDSNGVVTIKWKKNTEEDLRGYHIYRANADYHMFTMINSHPVEEPIFTDTITLKTLTEEIYYKVTAVDYQGHLSKFSETLKLTRPDILAPFPPSILGYDQEIDHIYFQWTPSRSKDVVKHKFYKKVNKGTWVELPNIDINSSIYKDYDVQPNNLYSYKIIAVDDANLESVDHAAVSMKFVDHSLPETLEILTCEKIDSQTVKITWNLPNDQKFKNIVIYRSINNGPLTVIDRKDKETECIDKINKNRQYSYAIKQTWIDGKKSAYSAIVSPK